MYPVAVALREKYAKTWIAAWVRDVSRETTSARRHISGGTSFNFFLEKLIIVALPKLILYAFTKIGHLGKSSPATISAILHIKGCYGKREARGSEASLDPPVFPILLYTQTARPGVPFVQHKGSRISQKGAG
jgi:hypothetical protein